MAELRGTVVARQGSATDLSVTFSAIGPDEYRADARRTDASGGPESDLHWLELGFVTVTPVSGAIDAESAADGSLARRLRRL
jgi:hypothetical protein